MEKCLVSLGQEVKLPAGVFVTCLNFEINVYQACMFISTLIIPVKTKQGSGGVRIAHGNSSVVCYLKPLYRLNNSWLMIFMSGLKICKVQRTLHIVAFKHLIHRIQSIAESFIGFSWFSELLIVNRECHTDGR